MKEKKNRQKCEHNPPRPSSGTVTLYCNELINRCKVTCLLTLLGHG